MKKFEKISEFLKHRNANYDDPTKGFNSVSRNVLIILLCILVVGGAALYTYLAYSYGSLYNFFVGEEKTKVSEVSTQYVAPEVSGNANLAICITSDGGSSAELFFVIGFDMDKKVVSCISLPLDTDIGGNKTLEESFNVGNTAQVIIGVEETFGITVDRYAQVTKSDFESALSNFAENVDVDLDEGVSYSSTDYSLNLQTGPNSLSAGDFVSLLRYDGWSGGYSAVCRHREQYFLNAVKSVLSAGFFEGGSDAFSSLIGYCDDTNVTVEDYELVQDSIGVLVNTAWRSNAVEITGKESGSAFTVSSDTVKNIAETFSESTDV